MALIGSTSAGIFGNLMSQPNLYAAKLLKAAGGAGSVAAGEFLDKSINKAFDKITPRNFEKFDRALGGILNVGRTATQEGPRDIPNDPLVNYQWAALIEDFVSQEYFITSITTPSLRYDTQSRFVGGKMNHYAGFLSVDDLSITLYTEVTGAAFNVMSEWFRLVRTKDGLYTPPAQYKKTVILYVLDQADNVVMQVHYVGAWPTSWNSYSLNYGSATMLSTDVTLSVDDLEIYVAGGMDERTT